MRRALLTVVLMLAAVLVASPPGPTSAVAPDPGTPDGVAARSASPALRVVVRGLPPGVRAKVVVKGRHGFHRAVKRSTKLGGLRPGRYRIAAKPVAVGDTVYSPTPARTKVRVRAGRKKVVVRYAAPVPRPRWTAISAGEDHTCGIQAPGRLWCWGANGAGQLGTGTTTGSTLPVLVGTASDWTAVSAGGDHTCGLRAGGNAYCWGGNGDGQLGIGSTSPSPVPTPVGGAASWLQIDAGEKNDTCAVRVDRTAWCWGNNDWYQTGQAVGPVRVPTQVGTNADWILLSSGRWHTCGLRGTASYCWGLAQEGQLGWSAPGGTSTPVAAVAGTWTAIAAGGQHSCGLRTDRTLWCWGANDHGQTADTVINYGRPPLQVGTFTDWSALSVAGDHSCGLRTGGSIWCWGDNATGQLGTGAGPGDVPAPVQPAGPADWIQVDTGTSHTCGIRTDGSAACWGAGSSGALGDGRGTASTVPASVLVAIPA